MSHVCAVIHGTMHFWTNAVHATCNAASEESSLLRSEPSLAVSSAELKGVQRPPQLSPLGTRCALLQLSIADTSCVVGLSYWTMPCVRLSTCTDGRVRSAADRARFLRILCSSRADSGGFEFRPGQEAAETPRSGQPLCAMPAPSDSLQVLYEFEHATEACRLLCTHHKAFNASPSHVSCVGCAGISRVQGGHSANVQVHPTSSSTVSEKSSLAAFGSEAEAPAGFDKQTAIASASPGGADGRASGVTEITPADDAEQLNSRGSKMQQLSPELAENGTLHHMVTIV